MLCCFLSTNRYGFGLSNKLLFIIIGQRAAKLCPVKVGGLKELPLVLLARQLGLVADPVIEAIARLEFEDGLRTGVLP